MQDLFLKYQLDRKIEHVEDFIATYHHYNEILWEQYRKGGIKKEALRQQRFVLTLKKFSIKDKQLATNINRDYLYICPRKNNLIPQAREVIEYLHRKYLLYIITNGFKTTQENKLNSSGLSPFFKRLFTSETIKINKPHPGIFAHAVNSVNAKKEECIMIGDDLQVDILGARQYGIDQVYFNPGKKTHEEKVTYEIEELVELKGIL